MTSGAPSLLAFTPISVPELRTQFLDFHESVLESSVGTVRRYRAATRHLEDYVLLQSRPPLTHELKPAAFAAYLRQVEVTPNGHPNTERRRLRDKGVRFILETCRSMYNFGMKRRHLPPYSENPFSELPLDRLKIEDAKPIFVFSEKTELSFLRASGRWSFPIQFTLAKTGLKVVAVGLGQDKSGEPARWEEVGPWLERQPEPAAEKKTREAPSPRASPSPRPATPELELNV